MKVVKYKLGEFKVSGNQCLPFYLYTFPELANFLPPDKSSSPPPVYYCVQDICSIFLSKFPDYIQSCLPVLRHFDPFYVIRRQDGELYVSNTALLSISYKFPDQPHLGQLCRFRLEEYQRGQANTVLLSLNFSSICRPLSAVEEDLAIVEDEIQRNYRPPTTPVTAHNYPASHMTRGNTAQGLTGHHDGLHSPHYDPRDRGDSARAMNRDLSRSHDSVIPHAPGYPSAPRSAYPAPGVRPGQMRDYQHSSRRPSHPDGMLDGAPPRKRQRSILRPEAYPPLPSPHPPGVMHPPYPPARPRSNPSPNQVQFPEVALSASSPSHSRDTNSKNSLNLTVMTSHYEESAPSSGLGSDAPFSAPANGPLPSQRNTRPLAQTMAKPHSNPPVNAHGATNSTQNLPPPGLVLPSPRVVTASSLPAHMTGPPHSSTVGSPLRASHIPSTNGPTGPTHASRVQGGFSQGVSPPQDHRRVSDVGLPTPLSRDHRHSFPSVSKSPQNTASLPLSKPNHSHGEVAPGLVSRGEQELASYALTPAASVNTPVQLPPLQAGGFSRPRISSVDTVGAARGLTDRYMSEALDMVRNKVERLGSLERQLEQQIQQASQVLATLERRTRKIDAADDGSMEKTIWDNPRFWTQLEGVVTRVVRHTTDSSAGYSPSPSSKDLSRHSFSEKGQLTGSCSEDGVSGNGVAESAAGHGGPLDILAENACTERKSSHTYTLSNSQPSPPMSNASPSSLRSTPTCQVLQNGGAPEDKANYTPQAQGIAGTKDSITTGTDQPNSNIPKSLMSPNVPYNTNGSPVAATSTRSLASMATTNSTSSTPIG
ncbi:hypothetical protein IWQ62_000072 [Dispira parvispora]|uniref:Uncharacterized protein n=1 Tax=Dispira parvispora TaxID=1520584 RepID=A0A9W8AVJ1_9FUNG|nr:hypothetical protein IWQ62_000072 [Dispira parvispora]